MDLYRASVLANEDPLQRCRLQIQFADPGSGSTWAEACLPAGQSATPRIGDTVWVAFEGGDANYPVWLGVAAPWVPG